MDFNYLTMTQKVALLLGIIFSVLAVASTFFAFKNADKIKSKVLGLILSLIMPFLAMTSWMILIFSFLDGFKNDDIMVIFVSLALAIVICLMILVISNALYRKHDKNMGGEEVETKEESKVIETELAQEEAATLEETEESETEETVVNEEETESATEMTDKNGEEIPEEVEEGMVTLDGDDLLMPNPDSTAWQEIEEPAADDTDANGDAE